MDEVRIVPLTGAHDRSSFDCGEPALDEFLRRYARQNQDRDVSRTFVATRPGERRVLGFFTLSAGAVEHGDLPPEEKRRLPRYPVPVVRLGRLAVGRRERGGGLGEALLVDALRRALRGADAVGAFAVEVVAKGEEARSFYLHYGFRPLEDDPLHLYLSMGTVRRLFR